MQWSQPRLSPSGCPRSLQVATFVVRNMLRAFQVRLPPQSPSRYIQEDEA